MPALHTLCLTANRLSSLMGLERLWATPECAQTGQCNYCVAELQLQQPGQHQHQEQEQEQQQEQQLQAWELQLQQLQPDIDIVGPHLAAPRSTCPASAAYFTSLSVLDVSYNSIPAVELLGEHSHLANLPRYGAAHKQAIVYVHIHINNTQAAKCLLMHNSTCTTTIAHRTGQQRRVRHQGSVTCSACVPASGRLAELLAEGSGMKVLPAVLGRFLHLSRLELGFNQLGGDVLLSLAQLPALCSLGLASNPVQTLPALPPEVNGTTLLVCSALRQLNLSGTCITRPQDLAPLHGHAPGLAQLMLGGTPLARTAAAATADPSCRALAGATWPGLQIDLHALPWSSGGPKSMGTRHKRSACQPCQPPPLVLIDEVGPTQRALAAAGAGAEHVAQHAALSAMLDRAHNTIDTWQARPSSLQPADSCPTQSAGDRQSDDGDDIQDRTFLTGVVKGRKHTRHSCCAVLCMRMPPAGAHPHVFCLLCMSASCHASTALAKRAMFNPQNSDFFTSNSCFVWYVDVRHPGVGIMGQLQLPGSNGAPSPGVQAADSLGGSEQLLPLPQQQLLQDPTERLAVALGLRVSQLAHHTHRAPRDTLGALHRLQHALAHPFAVAASTATASTTAALQHRYTTATMATAGKARSRPLAPLPQPIPLGLETRVVVEPKLEDVIQHMHARLAAVKGALMSEIEGSGNCHMTGGAS
jgi:hypothetical protein